MNFTKIVIASIVIAVLLLVFSWTVMLASILPRERVYSCDLAEISPDYPVQVKEACREARRK